MFPRMPGLPETLKFSMAAFVALTLCFAASCKGSRQKAGAPEPIVYGRDMCAVCRMHLSQPGFAGEIRDADKPVEKYDDVGCLLQALRSRGTPVPALVWVEDHKSGEWVALRSATFARGAKIKTPMGHGIVAFKDAATAKAFATEQGAEVVMFESLLAAPSPEASSPGTAKLARPGGPRPFADDEAKAGKELYLRECSACHGERSDGAGPAAPFLEPRPRDFTKRKFKLRTTPSGTPPATDDVLRVIEQGIPGSAMPSFFFLTVEERHRIAAYILDRADLLDGKEPQPVADPGEPPAATPELIARGKDLYDAMQCGSCHGPRGGGDGAAAKLLKDDEGRPIPVRDFTTGVFRGGAEPKDLYYRFVTGMDGSPMPSFGDSMKEGDAWALVRYVESLKVTPKPVPLPTDPVSAGRLVAAKYNCRGCHVLDDGKGGEVGPDLRISGQKLDSAWIVEFVKRPRDAGKIYPWRPYRMPHLSLTEEEANVVAKYLGVMGKRKSAAALVPDPSRFDEAKIAEGLNLFLLRCTECHNLGKVVEAPPIKHQGPDLIQVAGRVDYAWAKDWILDPKKIDPKTKMTTPGITPEQVDAVRMFVWKSSMKRGS